MAVETIYLFSSGGIIDERYIEKALLVIHEQLARAAVRLAGELNRALGQNRRAESSNFNDCTAPPGRIPNGRLSCNGEPSGIGTNQPRMPSKAFLVGRVRWRDMDMNSKKKRFAGPVVAATLNPTKPHGPRPFHRPTCSFVLAQTTVPEHWRSYSSPGEAIRAGHPRPCKRCLG